MGHAVVMAGLESDVGRRLARLRVAASVDLQRTDFGAPDGVPARITVPIATPDGDDPIQLALLAEVARTFADAETRRRVARARSFVELSLALRDAPMRGGGEH